MKKQSEDHYDSALRKRVIFDFIEANDRSPTREQLFELVREAHKSHPNLNSLGFSQFDIVVPHFSEESSASTYNQNNQAVRDDLVILDDKLNDLIGILETSYRSFKCTLDRCRKLNTSVEARLNNLLLLSGRTDVFVHGIEETFDTTEFVDLDKSTIEPNPGYVSLGRDKFKAKDLDRVTLSASCYAPNGKIGSMNLASPSNLLKKDGTDWTYTALANTPVGRVLCILEIDFNEEDGTYVGDIKLTGNPVDTNSTTSVTIYYSLNDSDYVLHQPGNIGLSPGENSFSMGKEKVKKIKVVLEKRAADFQESENVYGYLFSLDSLEILESNYTLKKESALYAGPYEVVDDLGKPVNFTLASMTHGTCCLIPDKTSIDFFLSKDGVTWLPASFRGDTADVVRFSSNVPGTTEVIDTEASSAHSLVGDPDKLVSLDVNLKHGEEAVCNTFLPESLSDQFVLQNTFVKRNKKEKDKEVYGVSSGWFNDLSNLRYRTTIKVDSFEGVVIDLGNTSAFINDKLVTGEILLPKGYHNFSTNYTNWVDVPEGLATIEELKKFDPLYPRNHKLMIEGYPYSEKFRGEKAYNKVGVENFGALLRYVSPEKFLGSEFDNDLYIYTVEEYNGNLFFKVKIDSKDASWVKEVVEIVYMLRSSDSNTVYVKALLRSEDIKITPNINRFQVRVI